MTEAIGVSDSLVTLYGADGNLSQGFSNILDLHVSEICTEVIAAMMPRPAPPSRQELQSVKFMILSRLTWELNFGLSPKKVEMMYNVMNERVGK